MRTPVLSGLFGAAAGAIAAILALSVRSPDPAPAPFSPDVLARLATMIERLDTVAERLGRWTPPTSPSALDIPQRERVDAGADRLTAVADQLSALVTTLQGKGAPASFRPPDLRERRSPTRWEDLAELARRAELDHAATKRELMLCGTADILALYGFPTDVFAHGSTLQFSYHREGMASAWFNFHDGLLVEFGASSP